MTGNFMERLYLDTNCFYFFFLEDTTYHPHLKKLFEKLHKGEITAITSAATLEELAYVTLMRLIERKFKKHPSEVLRENPSVVQEFSPKIETMFTTILSFVNLEIIPVLESDAALIPDTMGRYSLLPRDSLHVITMLRAGCKKIVSTDPDFDAVKNIERLEVTAL